MMDVFLPFQVEPRGGLKVFYTNTGFEYHRGDASLIHPDPAGTRDVEHGPDVRVYHWSGTEHGLGIWPPADAATVAADPRGWTERARNQRGVVNYGRLLRAALVNLDRWVTEGVLPPPGRHPRIADRTAVDPSALDATFVKIPGACYPRHQVRARRTSRRCRPRPGPSMAIRVSAVDRTATSRRASRARAPVPLATTPAGISVIPRAEESTRFSTSRAAPCPSRPRGPSVWPRATRAPPSPSVTHLARTIWPA